MKKAFLIFVILLFLLTNGLALKAEEGADIGFTIYPSIIELDNDIGESVSDTISVRNDMEFDLPVQLEVTLDNADLYANSEEILKCVSPEFNDIVVGSSSTREIELSVECPVGVEPASYIFTLIFKPILPSDFYQENASILIPYLGAVLAINYYEPDGDSGYGLETSNLEMSRFTTKKSVPLSFEVKNPGDYYKKVEYEVRSNNIFFREDVDMVNGSDNKVLLSGDSRIYKDNIRNSIGLNQVTISVIDQDGNKSDFTSKLIYLPIPLILVFLTLLVSSGYIIYKKRLQIKALFY